MVLFERSIVIAKYLAMVLLSMFLRESCALTSSEMLRESRLHHPDRISLRCGIGLGTGTSGILTLTDCLKSIHMARGGKRIGAGRPKDSKEKQTLVKEQALLELRQLVLAEIAPIVRALIAKATTGDVQAARELLDRAFGKAQQSIDHTTMGEKLPTPILNDLPED